MAIRPINEIYLNAGQMSNVGADGNQSDTVVSPVNAEIIGVAINVATGGITTLTTFGIETNGTLVDSILSLPTSIGADEGMVMVPTAKQYVEAGDVLRLESNGETGTTPAGYVTFMLRQ